MSVDNKLLLEKNLSCNKNKRRVRFWVPVMLCSLILTIWQLTVTLLQIPEYLLPSPHRILESFQQRWTDLIFDTYLTGAEAIVGFFFAVVVAAIAATVFAHSRVIHDLCMPFLISLKAIPLIAIAPMLVLWLGNGFLSKAVMAGTISFFPIVVNLTQGLYSIPEEQIDLFRTLSATRLQIFFRLRLPNSLPFLMAALKISSTLSVVGAIVAEFSGANRGIGNVILVASLRIDTPLLFCGLILASLLGIALFYCIDFAAQRIVFWESVS